jgi:hypothetical protein
MTDIISAIKAIKADAHVTVNGESVDGIIWHDDNPTNITNEEILAKQTELQDDYNALQYQRDREVAYPAMADQLDMQYWDQVNGTTTWKDAIAKVKTDNPKE